MTVRIGPNPIDRRAKDNLSRLTNDVADVLLIDALHPQVHLVARLLHCAVLLVELAQLSLHDCANALGHSCQLLHDCRLVAGMGDKVSFEEVDADLQRVCWLGLDELHTRLH